MQPTLEHVKLNLCGPDFLICAALTSTPTPHRHPAGQPVCPCHSEQNHPNRQWLHCPHQTWLSHPWTIPVPFIKSLTTGPSQELQEGSVDGQIKAERRVGCCCRGTAGLRIRGCPEKWMQIKQTLTSLPDSVEPPVGVWGSNPAKVKKIVLMYIWTQGLISWDPDLASQHLSIPISSLWALFADLPSLG